MTIPASLAAIFAALEDFNVSIVKFTTGVNEDSADLKAEAQDVYYTSMDNLQRSTRINSDFHNISLGADIGATLKTIGYISNNVQRYSRESAEYMQLNSILRMLGKTGK